MSEQSTAQPGRIWSGYLLALVLVVWQIKVAGWHGVTDNATLIEYGARKPNFGFPQAPWRLVASMFLHGGWIHLLANVFLVVVWGSQWARMVGAFGLWATFLVTGVWGNLVSDIYGPEALAVGASGGTSGGGSGSGGGGGGFMSGRGSSRSFNERGILLRATPLERQTF